MYETQNGSTCYLIGSSLSSTLVRSHFIQTIGPHILAPQLSGPTIWYNDNDALSEGTVEQRSRECTLPQKFAQSRNEVQTMDDQRASGAHRFLDFVERNRHSLQLLDRDRAYLIAEVDLTSANQVSWPEHDADDSDMFVFMLKAQWISDKYHEQHPNSNFATKELWRIRENRGVNSQGKLNEYATQRNMDYNRLRDTVQVNQKAGAIEVELEVPGLSETLYFALRRLKDLRQTEIEPFCKLFRASDSFAVFKSYAATGLALWDDYMTLMERHDLG